MTDQGEPVNERKPDARYERTLLSVTSIKHGTTLLKITSNDDNTTLGTVGGCLVMMFASVVVSIIFVYYVIVLVLSLFGA